MGDPIDLQRVVYNVEAVLHQKDTAVPGFDLQFGVRQAADQMIFRLTASVWSEAQAPVVIEHTWPASWWQMFKRDVLHVRRGIRMTGERSVVDPKVLYPGLKVSVPDQKYRLRFFSGSPIAITKVVGRKDPGAQAR